MATAVTLGSVVVHKHKLDRVKRIWYLSPEPPLLAHTSSVSRGTFRQKARSLAPLNGWACAVKICNDGMLEDTNSLDGAQLKVVRSAFRTSTHQCIKTAHITIKMKQDGCSAERPTLKRSSSRRPNENSSS